MFAENDKYSCSKCQSGFDKVSKLIFHRQNCDDDGGVNITDEISMVHPEVSAIVQDDFVKDDGDKCLVGGGEGFKMPDNFDLPDEIIQEQLPAARFTSTPIRYAKEESAKKSDSVDHAAKPKGEKQLLKSKAVSAMEDLAQKIHVKGACLLSEGCK